MMKPGSVLVSYVHSGGQVEHSWHVSMTYALLWDMTHEQRFADVPGPLRMRYGTGGIVEARNKIISYFLDSTEAEWLWWIDTDMGFPMDVVDSLIGAADPVKRPVVGALCFALRQSEPDGLGGYRTEPIPTIYGWGESPSGTIGFHPAVSYPENTVLRVAGTGGACLLMHRSALDRVREQYGDTWCDPVRYADGRTLSEDLSFCYRLARLDIPMYVHTGVKTSHAKQVWVGEPDWLLRQASDQAKRSQMAVEPRKTVGGSEVLPPMAQRVPEMSAHE